MLDDIEVLFEFEHKFPLNVEDKLDKKHVRMDMNFFDVIDRQHQFHDD